MIQITAMKVETVEHAGGEVSLMVQLRIDRLRSTHYAAWIAGQIHGAILSNGFIPPKDIITNFPVPEVDS